MIRLRTSYFAAALLAACSPVEDNREVDAPEADTTAPGILKATPADMARKVSVLQPLTVVFDEDIDPATVTAATVELSYANHEPVPYANLSIAFPPRGPGMPTHVVAGAVTYDDIARTVRFVPKAPLPYGKRFTLALTGVKDLAGNELTSTVKFITAVNREVRVRPYSVTAQPMPYSTTPPDANGFQDKYVRFDGPGTDMLWFNDNDVVGSVWDLVNKPNGQIDMEWSMTPGVDTFPNTNDDVRSYGLTYTYDAAGNWTESVGHNIGQQGADGMFGTPDDGILFNVVTKYQMGLPVNFVYYDNPGLIDMGWRTADDQCMLLHEMTYDAGGHRTREVIKGCGTDRLPFNVDDVFTMYSEFQYDTNHALTRVIERDGAGTNALWLDSDDVIDHVENYTVDPNGLATEHRYYTGPGLNAVWDNGSGDDVIGRLTKWTYDANKQPIQITSYGAGLDTNLGTSDDVVVSYQQTTYDAFGNRVRTRSFDVGPDNAPYTGDDRLLLDTDYDTMH